MNISGKIMKSFSDHINIINRNEEILSKSIEILCTKTINTIENGKKIILFGNGGSAADCQHIAAELVGRFSCERKALPAIALTTDTSILTSICNDYSYSKVFSRQLEALGNAGDLCIGISTSGNSKNIIEGFIKARELSMCTVSLSGKSGGKCKDYADISIIVDDNKTARIQEIHIIIGHILCEIIDEYYNSDNTMLGKDKGRYGK